MVSAAMKQLIRIVACVAAAASLQASASEGARLQAAPINGQDLASLQNGAKLYISYCLGCHSAKYIRYERLAADLLRHLSVGVGDE